jgi:hypothetical protein
MHTQIVMDATGDTRHQSMLMTKRRWPRPSGGSWN